MSRWGGGWGEAPKIVLIIFLGINQRESRIPLYYKLHIYQSLTYPTRHHDKQTLKSAGDVVLHVRM